MIFKYQYETQEGKQNIININKDKFLIEEQNITEGNFLIFSDTPRVEEQIVKLQQDNITLMDAMASMYEELLNLQSTLNV